jgi:hypothetical protein
MRLGDRNRPALLVLAVALALAPGACKLDEVPTDGLIGPSETGVSVQLTALPDTLNADGVSTAAVLLVLRGQDGQPINGRAVYFAHNGDGLLGPSSPAGYVGPVQTGFVMATNSSGEARVTYVAGTGLGTVQVFVRPYGIDGASFFERSVDILQR